VPDYKIVLCDIDGCLSPEDSVPMDVARLSRVAAWNDRINQGGTGPLLTLCSGRPLAFVEAMCRFLQNASWPCLGENGVWLYDPKQNLYLMDPTITDEHLAMVAEAARWTKQHFGPQGITLQPGKNASVTLHHSDTAFLERVCVQVRDEFSKRGWPFRVSMTWSYINCDLQHISKATGIQRLFERTGLTSSNAIGIGDTMSDKAIADNVDFFACPANAAEPLKQIADYVSPYSETEGVLDILERVVAGKDD
jgi:hydroxymethylpyrimidine pyrophosphatase-like HAD family hydrolase